MKTLTIAGRRCDFPEQRSSPFHNQHPVRVARCYPDHPGEERPPGERAPRGRAGTLAREVAT